MDGAVALELTPTNAATAMVAMKPLITSNGEYDVHELGETFGTCSEWRTAFRWLVSARILLASVSEVKCRE